MHKFKRTLRTIVLYSATVVLVGGVPMAAFAEDPETYTYDAATGRWNSNKWVYDPATDVYVPVDNPTQPPTPTPTPVDQTPSSDDNPPAQAEQVGALNETSQADGNASVDQTTNGTSDTNVNTNASINNSLNSDATTGGAGVKRNTTAGSAMSGEASAATTIVNSVHSTVGGETSGVAHFTTDLYGDITGDITIGPAIENAKVTKNTNLSSTTNVNNNDTLTNDLTLKATSGNADVTGNTTAGSAKTGNANTVADVLNLINTIIAANKSFVGTINIHGNLDGDILVSPDFIPQLLASNAQVVGNYTMPLSTTINDDQSIVNNVKLNATTGTATVRDNTAAGNANTGTAATNLTILNLTGHKVDAAKSLLVFVNVLGKWVGMIVDAPGATAAALGSGVVTENTTISDTTNINNNAKITNNLDLTSRSGDASVTSNTSGGDATTGDATASANIANISTSEFNLSDWFGVLFINVFGSWVGSFGIDTAAGTVVPLGGMAVPASPSATIGAPNLHFGYSQVPHTGTALFGAGGTSAAGGSGTPDSAAAAAILASARLNGRPPFNGQTILTPGVSPREDPLSTIMMITGFTILSGAGVLWVIRRLAAFRSAAI